MEKQEFTQRTGLVPSSEEFATIHRIYMMCATLDKDKFCREYKKHGTSCIIKELECAVIAEKHKTDSIFTKLTDLEGAISKRNLEMAEFLIGKAVAHDDLDFESKALELVPRCTAILIKAKNGYPMTADDLAYIAKNLK